MNHILFMVLLLAVWLVLTVIIFTTNSKIPKKILSLEEAIFVNFAHGFTNFTLSQLDTGKFVNVYRNVHQKPGYTVKIESFGIMDNGAAWDEKLHSNDKISLLSYNYENDEYIFKGKMFAKCPSTHFLDPIGNKCKRKLWNCTDDQIANKVKKGYLMQDLLFDNGLSLKLLHLCIILKVIRYILNFTMIVPKER